MHARKRLGSPTGSGSGTLNTARKSPINSLNNNTKICPNNTNMTVLMIKAVSRNALRRTHFPSRQQPNITKRHSTNSNLATRPKVEDDPANGTAIPIPATVANVPLWQRLGPLSRGFQAYGRSQRKRPYATQFCSSLVIYFLGDLSAQNINGDEYDPKRMLRALVISAGSSIPSYKWYIFPRI
jgi:protein Mpv17